ncbi:hypothetical protein FN846DRAFT_1023349 [Sphaerosporella brunnea]|uniref:Cytochrome p450 protein n=1 Tax=Sphaerosporella brunnea TaxID=1250544 RepID=A0A5J5EP48_9PEZI|nr:hypothetical protein FN846DRAFT_1023349 [Sphaerosporella brunnea]
MLFNLNTAVSLLALGAFASAATLEHKRDAATGTSLYAYGTNVSGINVFYGDGLAYTGTTIPDWINVASNVTFNFDSTDTKVPWTITSNTSTAITGSQLYVIPTSGKFQQVGFVASNGTAPTGAATSGFTWFGTMLAYSESSSNMEMKFWASPTNTSGVWALMWNADGTTDGTSVPVVLKRTPPTVLTRT